MRRYETIRRSALRVVVAVCAAVAMLLAAPVDRAEAGTYTVTACTDADNRNNLFAPWVNRVAEATPTSFGSCHATPSGLRTRTGDRSPDAAAFEFCAPPGTTVANIDVSHRTTWKGSGFAVYADSGSCNPYKLARGTALPSSIGVVGDTGWVNWKQSGFGGRGVRLLTSCEHDPCQGGGFADTSWRNLRFEIDDPVPPTVTAAPTTWLRGTAQSLSITATDNAGVERVEAGVAGRPDVGWTADARQTSCDFTRVTRCPTTLSLPAVLDTTKLPDGTSDLKVSAQDVGSNSSPVLSHPLRVDNTPPSAKLVREPNDYSRTIAWRVTDDHSGVDGSSLAAVYRVDGTSHPLSGGSWNAADGTYSVALPNAVADGTVEVVLRGADSATPGGNRFEQTDNVTTDATPPGAPVVVAPAGWINRANAGHAAADFSTPPPAPVSGIAGYSVTTDGSEPDASVDVEEQLQLTDLPDGTTNLRVRSVSRAGVAGPASSRTIRSDRTDPTLSLLGAGDPLTPHPGPITVTISARDATSGMGGAERPEDGGFVAYRLDGGEEVRSPGDEVQVAITGEGTHSLKYRAVDRAGNPSEWHERRIVIWSARERNKERRRFWATSSNAVTAFTAATTFTATCPDAATLVADRRASIREDEQPTAGLEVGAVPGFRAESLLGFSLPAAPGCRVASARLRLFVLAGDAQLDIRRAGAAWHEDTPWQLRPGATGSTGTAVGEVGGWAEVDVRDHVDAMYRLGDNGFVISARGGEATIASGDPDISPVLILEFAR